MRRRASRTLPAVVAAFALLAVVAAAGAATLPSGFVETEVVSGLGAPTAMAFAPDGRLFVAEQGGRLRVIKNGALLAQPFLTVTVDSSGERGLLGVAFDPAFASNGYVYVYYTATTPTLHNRVSRFTASGDVAAAGSEVPILDLNDLSGATNHNGGAIHFGPDGKLYIAVGDNANGANSQTLKNLLGKILRINSDGTIPADNPFLASATGNNAAIWALGLRNPFTFSFQPGTTRMFINDVGENTWEEINDGIAASNYGWPTTEGPTTDPRFRSPIFWYGHGTGPTTGCAITGGAFYNPPVVQFPAVFVGTYFFADVCSGWIRHLDPANGNVVRDFATGAAAPVDLAVASDGTLYYLTRGGASGSVYRVSSTGAGAPTITTQPTSQTTSAGSTVSFSVSASGTPPLSYQWQRNAVDIPGATSSTYTIASAQSTDDGARFRVRVSNAAGNTTSNDAVLSVTVLQLNSTIATQIHNAAHQVVTTAEAGSIVHDFVTVTGQPNQPTPAGDVIVDWFTNGTCSGDVPAANSGNEPLVNGRVDATNFSQGPLATGSFSFRARYLGDNTYPPSVGECEPLQVVSSVTPQKANQTISFEPLTAKTYGDPDIPVVALASSGLPVSLAASGSCTVTGAIVHITGAGSCTVTATQAGDANYAAAPAASHTFAIAKAQQAITFAPLARKVYGEPDFTVRASASSGLPVSFSASGRCTVSGATVHLTRPGACTITASQPGDANYDSAPPASQTFTIARPPCRVPKVVGKKLAAAKATLASRNCRAGEVRYTRSSKRKGVVTRQSRPPGRVLPVDAKINLVVSRGHK